MPATRSAHPPNSIAEGMESKRSRDQTSIEAFLTSKAESVTDSSATDTDSESTVLPLKVSLPPPFTEDSLIPYKCRSDAVFLWSFLMSFSPVLRIYPFSLREFECALADRANTSTPIISTIFLRLLKLIAKERGDSGRQSLARIVEMTDGMLPKPEACACHRESPLYEVVHSSEPVELFYASGGAGKPTKIKWHSDRFNDSNWFSMLVAFLCEAAASHSVRQRCSTITWLLTVPDGSHPGSTFCELATEEKLSLMRTLVEIVLLFPVCKKHVDSAMESLFELRKQKRLFEISLRKASREAEVADRALSHFRATVAVERLTFLGGSGEQPESGDASQSAKKEERALLKQLRAALEAIESAEQSIAACQAEMKKNSIARMEPIARDEAASYWIFNCHGADVASGRLYVVSSSGGWDYYDRVDQYEEFLKSISDAKLAGAIKSHDSVIRQNFHSLPSQSQSQSSQTAQGDLVSSGRGKRNSRDPAQSYLLYRNKAD